MGRLWTKEEKPEPEKEIPKRKEDKPAAGVQKPLNTIESRILLCLNPAQFSLKLALYKVVPGLEPYLLCNATARLDDLEIWEYEYFRFGRPQEGGIHADKGLNGHSDVLEIFLKEKILVDKYLEVARERRGNKTWKLDNLADIGQVCILMPCGGEMMGPVVLEPMSNTNIAFEEQKIVRDARKVARVDNELSLSILERSQYLLPWAKHVVFFDSAFTLQVDELRRIDWKATKVAKVNEEKEDQKKQEEEDAIQAHFTPHVFPNGMPQSGTTTNKNEKKEARLVKRYGTHGISYSHAMRTVCARREETPDQAEIMVIHMGNRVSGFAWRLGHVLDATMSIPTGTAPRISSGWSSSQNIDFITSHPAQPEVSYTRNFAIIAECQRARTGLNAKPVSELQAAADLPGGYERRSDALKDPGMETLEERKARERRENPRKFILRDPGPACPTGPQPPPHATYLFESLINEVVSLIFTMNASMDGDVRTIVLTGGILEHSDIVRASVLEKLSQFELSINYNANEIVDVENGFSIGEIQSTGTYQTRVMVVIADEVGEMAKQWVVDKKMGLTKRRWTEVDSERNPKKGKLGLGISAAKLADGFANMDL